MDADNGRRQRCQDGGWLKKEERGMKANTPDSRSRE